jgi:hypothetical protein
MPLGRLGASSFLPSIRQRTAILREVEDRRAPLNLGAVGQFSIDPVQLHPIDEAGGDFDLAFETGRNHVPRFANIRLQFRSCERPL